MINRLFELLKNNNETVSFAESCTGGMLASSLTDVEGASNYFNMGVITYSNDAKTKLLGVSPDTLKKHGAVSPETAAEMAKGVRKLSNSGVSASVTGIAGPGGGTAEKPVGLVYIGVSGIGGTYTYKNNFTGGRNDVRRKTCAEAIRLLCEYIEKFYG